MSCYVFTMLNHGFMTGLKPGTLLSMRNINLQDAKGDIRTSVKDTLAQDFWLLFFHQKH